MNKNTFIQLIQSPSSVSKSNIEELEKLIQGFPYCQIAHILLAKSAYESGNMHSDEYIKKASLYTADRKNLKNLLNHSDLEENNATINTPELNQDAEVLQPLKNPGKKKATGYESSKTDFLEELQKNLDELRRLKERAALGPEKKQPIQEQTPVKKTTIITPLNPLKEIPPAVDKTEENKTDDISDFFSTENLPALSEHWRDDFKKAAPKDLQDISAESNDSTDDLLSENSLPNTLPTNQEEGDVLLDYLDYLNHKRNKFKKDKNKEDKIISRFIKEDPTIPYLNIDKIPEKQEDLASSSTKYPAFMVSENFAKILVKQGKRDKAIDIYNQLILKNPEKRAYFTSLIEELTKNI